MSAREVINERASGRVSAHHLFEVGYRTEGDSDDGLLAGLDGNVSLKRPVSLW